ncbi:Gldg family protein [Acidobacteriota bacterium]
MDQKKLMTKYYKFGLYLVIVILINLVGLSLFFRVDFTANRLYSLSKASKRAVSTLREPLTINVFFSKNLPAPYNNIEKYLHDLLEEYALHANNYLSYRFFDVSAKEGDISEKAEENRKKAQDYGIYPVNVQTIEQDEAKVQRAFMGMVFIHGDIIEKIPAISSTEGLEYDITNTIIKMNNKISALLNLTEKIKIKLIQSSSLLQIAEEINLAGLEGLKGSVEDVVRILNSKVYDQLEFVYVDPTLENVEAEVLNKYQRFGLQWPQLQKENGDIVPAGEGIIALGIEYQGRSRERQLLNKNLSLTSMGLQEQFGLEEMEPIQAFIEENVDNLININDEIGYLSTHGTLSLSPALPPQFQMMQQQPDSLTNFNSLLSSNYSVQQIDLKEDNIPESIDTLIIAGAKESFSDWELFQIDQFLMKGKSLALFVDAFNEIQQQNQPQQMYGMSQPLYFPIDSGLEKLLNNYGLSVKKSYLLDESCFVNRDRNLEEIPIYFAPIIKDENINHKFAFMENIKQLITIKISPLEIDEEKLKGNNLETERLFSSSKDSWEMTGQINLNPLMIRPPMREEDKKARPLACITEGEFQSYFAGKPVPAKPEKEDETESTDEEEVEKEKPEIQESKIKEQEGILVKGKPGKVFLIGSSEILKDNVLDDQGKSPNAVFLLNTIDYLNNNEDIAVMRSKNQRFNPLKDSKPGTRTFIKVLNIAGLPLMLIMVGISVWVHRKTRRRVIQTMFSKKNDRKEKLK